MQAGAFAVEERCDRRSIESSCAPCSATRSSTPAVWACCRRRGRCTSSRSTPTPPTRGVSTSRRSRSPTISSCVRRGCHRCRSTVSSRWRSSRAATFGLGDHPTTRLSAAAVWRTAAGAGRVLDVGCGSGVLAIVAVLAGAAQATAIDIAGRRSAGRARQRTPQSRGGPHRCLDDTARDWSTVSSTSWSPTSWRRTLIALAGELRRVTAPGGVLIVSGVLADHTTMCWKRWRRWRS